MPKTIKKPSKKIANAMKRAGLDPSWPPDQKTWKEWKGSAALPKPSTIPSPDDMD